MAALTLKQALQKLQGYLQSGGYVHGALIGEPKGPPAGNAITAAIFLRTSTVAFLVLGEVTLLHTVTVRFYRNMLAEPIEDTEFQLAAASTTAMLDTLSQLDLQGGFSNPDIATVYTEPIAGQWGYQEIGGVMFRIVDFSVPLPISGS